MDYFSIRISVYFTIFNHMLPALFPKVYSLKIVACILQGIIIITNENAFYFDIEA